MKFLKTKLYIPNEKIIIQGEEAHIMYIIIFGKVIVTLKKYENDV